VKRKITGDRPAGQKQLLVAAIGRLIIYLAMTLLVACSSTSTITPQLSPTPILEYSLPTQPTTTPSPTRTLIPTQANTLTPTITPSVTHTPTEDRSFYAVAGCLPQDTGYQRGVVTRVIDGDTIEVELGEGVTTTVRYIGIDAPEYGFPFFGEASSINTELVSGKTVVMVKDQSETDQFKRWLRYVFAGNVFVNQELVRAGMAQARNYPPDEACAQTLADAEEEARQGMVGLWAATPTLEPGAGQMVIWEVNKREEWVDIQNVGDFTVDLAGWSLVSERGEQACFLEGELAAGETLRIWAMEALGEGFSCGYSSPIWNNSEPDPAVLYNPQGVEVSRK
jgi:micrococcal nuclease